jgi:hypothetical protein
VSGTGSVELTPHASKRLFLNREPEDGDALGKPPRRRQQCRRRQPHRLFIHIQIKHGHVQPDRTQRPTPGRYPGRGGALLSRGRKKHMNRTDRSICLKIFGAEHMTSRHKAPIIDQDG